jgi:UDP-N-acetylmuramyl pentapeptide phosphotransferase/UDP-N-acetylglucosamine-1-phosphate transferase
VAIFLTLWCIALLAHWVPEHFGMSEFPLSQLTVKILGPATIIFLLGLIDDFCELSVHQVFRAGIGGRAAVFQWNWNFPVDDSRGSPPPGLAAGSALLSTLVSCVVAMVGHNDIVLILTLALAGAITGFLRYNFNPASIFLGDCGSLLIGFLISAIAIAGSHKSPTMVPVAIPIVSLGLPIPDVAFAVLRAFLEQ